MIDRLDWTSQRLTRYQSAALRRLVAHARLASPWHQRRLADVDATRLDRQALRALPIMGKPDLMENFDQIVTDRRLRLDLVENHLATASGDDLLDQYVPIASSGSSGQRAVVVSDRVEWAIRWLGYLRWELRAWNRDPSLAGVPMAMASVGSAQPSHGSRALPQRVSLPGVTCHPLAVSQPMDEIVEALNHLQPAILCGYTSALLTLAEEQAAGRLRIQPRRIVTFAEPLLPELRVALATTWDTPIRNWYGCSEAGPLAISCEEDRGLHLAEDLVIVEAVDETGRPVPEGRPAARVLVTNLHNPALPLIRYELTDEVTILGEPCPCGCPQRLIADPLGRDDDVFTYGRVRVHPNVFRSVLGHPDVFEYEVRQTLSGANISVRCRAGFEPGQFGPAVTDALRRLGVPSPRVVVCSIEHLPREKDAMKRDPLGTSARVPDGPDRGRGRAHSGARGGPDDDRRRV